MRNRSLWFAFAGPRPGRKPQAFVFQTRAVRWVVLVVLAFSSVAHGAFTEPRLALMRGTPYRSASGRITLKLEGTYSFADALQLALPVSVTVTQGTMRARFDLAGNVSTSLNGGPEEPAPGPGLVSIGERDITVVLPSDFSGGAATAQIVLTYEGRPIASNLLDVTL
jgi:hypothetical protein